MATKITKKITKKTKKKAATRVRGPRKKLLRRRRGPLLNEKQSKVLRDAFDREASWVNAVLDALEGGADHRRAVELGVALREARAARGFNEQTGRTFRYSLMVLREERGAYVDQQFWEDCVSKMLRANPKRQPHWYAAAADALVEARRSLFPSPADLLSRAGLIAKKKTK